jgi:uncharacterized protein
MKAAINIEVCFALADKQIAVPVKVHPGATMAEAIQMSKILQECAGIDLEKNRVGIFGKVAKLDTVLRDGDRVEIYRPLIADPKDARRKRAARSKKI